MDSSTEPGAGGAGVSGRLGAVATGAAATSAFGLTTFFFGALVSTEDAGVVGVVSGAVGADAGFAAGSVAATGAGSGAGGGLVRVLRTPIAITSIAATAASAPTRNFLLRPMRCGPATGLLPVPPTAA